MAEQPDLSYGLEEMAGLISYRVGVWHDGGYTDPPSPECKVIPPLGERSAKAITGGHEAIEAIDDLLRRLYALRGQLLDELRADQDVRAARNRRLVTFYEAGTARAMAAACIQAAEALEKMEAAQVPLADLAAEARS
jgi:hypothetical protein